MRATWVLVWVALVAGESCEAAAEEVDPYALLQGIRLQFRQGNYERVERLAARLFELEPSTLMRAEGLQFLGAALELLGRSEEAEEQFELLLTLQPSFHIDPAEFPTEVIRLFETVRLRVQDRLEQIDERRRRTRQQDRREREEQLRQQTGRTRLVPRYLLREAEVRHLAVAFLPFGAGQFQNNQPQKGYAFLGTQLGLGATSMALWLVATLSPDNAEEVERARRVMMGYQVASYVVYSALVVSVVWGIVDALVHYRRHRDRWRLLQETDVPENLRLVRPERDESAREPSRR